MSIAGVSDPLPDWDVVAWDVVEAGDVAHDAMPNSPAASDRARSVEVRGGRRNESVFTFGIR